MKQDNDIINAIITAFAGIALGAFVLCCFFGCKSQQITTQASGRDSMLVHHRYDTTYIQIYDTTRITVQQVEKIDEGTTIQFVSEGGSMNLLTGDVHGVKSVRSNKQSLTNTQTITEWRSGVESLQATSDSLRQVIKCYQIASETKTNTSDIKPQRSSYDRFCSWFFWCVLIAGLIALVWWWTERRFGWWTILKALMKI